MSRCGIIILAAGNSSRLGFAKQLVKLDGSTLLARSAKNAVASLCRPVVVVLGANAEQMRSEIEHLPITVAINSQWQTGMGSSIRCGVQSAIATDAKIDSILIAMCDQYRITSASIDRLVMAHVSAGKPITVAAYADTLGTPAIFASPLFSELLNLPDNRGGRSIIQRHPDDVEAVPMPEAQADLDTMADYDELGSPAVSQLNRSTAGEDLKSS